MKITLIDDHILLSTSLKSLLNSNGFSDVNQFNKAEDFLSYVKFQSDFPDVIITDLVMPDMNGLQFLEKIQQQYKGKAKIIVLTSMTNVQTIKQVIRAGANGFLSKASTIEELIEAIQYIQTGKQYIERSLRESLLNTVFTEEQIVYHLSPREKKVLQKVCSGLTIKEIAYELNLSAHTVQYYHRNVLAKLKVKRTSDLIVFAMQNGLYIPEIK